MDLKKVWVTADYHLGHGNIIKYCSRPYKDFTEMDEAIINNHNALVGKDDAVFHAGDFCFNGRHEEYLHRLNGRVILIDGNHDKQKLIRGVMLDCDGLSIWITHLPRDYNPSANLNLVGHVHNHWRTRIFKRGKRRSLLVNIGLDVWDYRPVSLAGVIPKSFLAKQQTCPPQKE